MTDNIEFVRDTANKRDFRVLINGEHRANFRSRMSWGKSGYDFEAADGGHIRLRKRYFLTAPNKDEFAEVVQCAIDERQLPSVAEIKRVRMIEQAMRENREWDDARSRRRAQMHREITQAALQLFLVNPPDVIADDEHKEMARMMLQQVMRS